MKTKKMAKPIKGSAKTKRFMDGGTVGALAGLGTLAYLMSRKKDKDKDGATESGGMSKDPNSSSVMDTMKKNAEVSEGQRRAMAASAGRPEMGDIDSDAMESDKALVRRDTAPPKVTPVRKNVVKSAPAPKNITRTTPTPPADNDTRPPKAYPINSKPNEERPSKPYPINSKPNEERSSKVMPGAKPYPINSKPNEERPSKPIPEAKVNNESSSFTTSKPEVKSTEVVKPAAKPAEKPAAKPAEKKYGIGPHGAFSTVHKAISEYKTPAQNRAEERKKREAAPLKKGGKVVKMAKGGLTRGDGCCSRGKTKGTMR